jgi:hypothetical protein
MIPNQTAHGFGLARCPEELLAALQKGIKDGLPTAPSEGNVDAINGPNQPLFINRRDLTQRVLQELRPYAEEWSGVELIPAQAYGFRLYQNESQLTMHVDRLQTNVISFILHIDSTEDAEPWPIFIEDFQGKTHEAILTPLLGTRASPIMYMRFNTLRVTKEQSMASAAWRGLHTAPYS